MGLPQDLDQQMHIFCIYNNTNIQVLACNMEVRNYDIHMYTLSRGISVLICVGVQCCEQNAAYTDTASALHIYMVCYKSPQICLVLHWQDNFVIYRAHMYPEGSPCLMLVGSSPLWKGRRVKHSDSNQLMVIYPPSRPC